MWGDPEPDIDAACVSESKGDVKQTGVLVFFLHARKTCPTSVPWLNKARNTSCVGKRFFSSAVCKAAKYKDIDNLTLWSMVVLQELWFAPAVLKHFHYSECKYPESERLRKGCVCPVTDWWPVKPPATLAGNRCQLTVPWIYNHIST